MPVPTGRLEKDFVLVQSVGSGEFSKVWKVRGKKDGRLWAVKAGKPYTGLKNRLVPSSRAVLFDTMLTIERQAETARRSLDPPPTLVQPSSARHRLFRLMGTP